MAYFNSDPTSISRFREITSNRDKSSINSIHCMKVRCKLCNKQLNLSEAKRHKGTSRHNPTWYQCKDECAVDKVTQHSP